MSEGGQEKGEGWRGGGGILTFQRPMVFVFSCLVSSSFPGTEISRYTSDMYNIVLAIIERVCRIVSQVDEEILYHRILDNFIESHIFFKIPIKFFKEEPNCKGRHADNFLVRKSQIRKFLSLFRYRKYANFLCISQIRYFFVNPQILIGVPVR